jgi:hypothetical protein
VLIDSVLSDLSVEERMSSITVFEVTNKPPQEEFGRIFEEHYEVKVLVIEHSEN